MCNFAFDWFREWHLLCAPTMERSKAKPKQSLISFDTQLKTALYELITGQTVTSRIRVGQLAKETSSWTS